VRVYRLIMSGLIEDKMFRLQVFKMGLTKTALEADQGHRYFSSREIRALFEWTDPVEGETRKMLLEKHGEEKAEATSEAARQDGSDSWLEAGPAVGLSDFTTLYGAMVQEDAVPDAAVSAQVMEAKQKLGAADEKFQRMQAAKQEAEDHRDAVLKELEEVTGSISHLNEQRTQAEQALKERRKELTEARRCEATAQQQLEKTGKMLSYAQDQLMRAQQTTAWSNEAADSTGKSLSDAATSARKATDDFLKAVGEAEGQLALFDDNGCGKGNSLVDAGKGELKKAHKALEKMRVAVESVEKHQADLQSAEDELLRLDGSVAEAEAAVATLGDSREGGLIAASRRKDADNVRRDREKERQKAEQTQARAQKSAEVAREKALEAAQNMVEVCCKGFTESFTKTQSRPVRMDQVKTAQGNAKAIFRQVQTAWKPVATAWETWDKVAPKRRKVADKARATSAEEAEAAAAVKDAERDQAEAAAEEQRRLGERKARESELEQAEVCKAAAERKETDARRRRDELRSEKPAALDAVKNSRAAEKEAAQERLALHNNCSKVEKAHLQLEEAKSSAMQSLMAEEYDASQVEKAYQRKQDAD
jgi:hypothetical protein